MYRRAYVLLVGTAFVMGALAVIAAIVLDKRLADPEGFLGPSWLRLPMLLLGAFLLDMLPRTLWHSRLRSAARCPRSSANGCARTGPASGSPWW